MDSVEPFHATPRNDTESPYLLAASSTEGASLLQVPQPGAQNQRTIGPSVSSKTLESTNRLGEFDEEISLVGEPHPTRAIPINENSAKGNSLVIRFTTRHPLMSSSQLRLRPK